MVLMVFHYLYRREQKTDSHEGAQWQFEKLQPKVTTQKTPIKHMNTINIYVGGQTLDQKPSESACPSFEIPRIQLVLQSLAGSALSSCTEPDGIQRCLAV